MSNPAAVEGYRLARLAQDARFTEWTGGRLECEDAKDRKQPEYAEYFGVGEFAGGGVEPRLTLQRWLVASRGPSLEEREAWQDVAPAVAVPVCITEESAFVLAGSVLAVLADSGDYVAGAELDRRAARRAAKRANRSVAA